MDHDLRLISYIADVGSILVLMVRRSHLPVRSQSSNEATTTTSSSPSTSTAPPPSSISSRSIDDPANGGTSSEDSNDINAESCERTPSKIICHLFESDEVGRVW